MTKALLKKVYRLVSRFSRTLVFFVIKLIAVRIKAKVVVKYDAKQVKDGFGAQLHRIVSLLHVAHQLKFEVIKPEILEVAIHPLDPIKTLSEMRTFLAKSNDVLFQSSLYVAEKKTYKQNRILRIDSLNLKGICKVLISTFWRTEPTILVSCEAHSLADLVVDKYSETLNLYFKFFLENQVGTNKREVLILHYRQGAGNFAIYPGQRIPRQIHLDYFLGVISEILSAKESRIKKLRVFTDSPREDIEFSPLKEQLDLWVGTPGFHGQSVTYKGIDIENYFNLISKRYGVEVMIERNLDPLEMIIEMANASVLIISRSSLSYIAGLFNSKGSVYFAPGFWHARPRQWLISTRE